MTTAFNLKEVFEESKYWRNFRFEVNLNGMVRIYIGDRRTKYVAGGGGYDKISTVIAHMVNDLVGIQEYDPKEYGHYKGSLSSGVGFEALKKAFESIDGNKIDMLYYGRNSNIYEITFGEKIC